MVAPGPLEITGEHDRPTGWCKLEQLRSLLTSYLRVLGFEMRRANGEFKPIDSNIRETVATTKRECAASAKQRISDAGLIPSSLAGADFDITSSQQGISVRYSDGDLAIARLSREFNVGGDHRRCDIVLNTPVGQV